MCVVYAQKGLALLFCYSPNLAYMVWSSLVGDLAGDLLETELGPLWCKFMLIDNQ